MDFNVIIGEVRCETFFIHLNVIWLLQNISTTLNFWSSGLVWVTYKAVCTRLVNVILSYPFVDDQMYLTKFQNISSGNTTSSLLFWTYPPSLQRTCFHSMKLMQNISTLNLHNNNGADGVHNSNPVVSARSTPPSWLLLVDCRRPPLAVALHEICQADAINRCNYRRCGQQHITQQLKKTATDMQMDRRTHRPINRQTEKWLKRKGLRPAAAKLQRKTINRPRRLGCLFAS